MCISRDKAYELVSQRLGQGPTLSHCMACEACMRALADHFGEDVDEWGLAGLVHDLDLDECQDDLARHALVAAEVLKKEGFASSIVNAVLGHNDKAERISRLDKALWVVDPTTGMITASALVRPSKSTSDLSVKSIKKRMKDKRFAAAVNREQIRECENVLGLSLDEFLNICLGAMDNVRDELGLAGS